MERKGLALVERRGLGHEQEGPCDARGRDVSEHDVLGRGEQGRDAGERDARAHDGQGRDGWGGGEARDLSRGLSPAGRSQPRPQRTSPGLGCRPEMQRPWQPRTWGPRGPCTLPRCP